MGGRGSSGGRSGGGGGASQTPKVVNPNTYYQENFSKLNDAELNKAYKNSQRLMNKEKATLQDEINKLRKLNSDVINIQESDKDYASKVEQRNKQIEKVRNARTRVEFRENAFYSAVNEKYNVRGKQSPSDIKSMTDGQLNSYYNKTYKEGLKARTRLENTKDSKTRAKYQKLYEEHNQNFFKANAEKEKRGLWGKGW